MAMELQNLVESINELLSIKRFKDYCPNGLQVEGRPTINKIVSGVTASQALIEQAVAQGADAILVHHGYFWKGEDACITGIKKQRLQYLLKHDVSLLAYHLPLDGHAQLGNNAQLAQLLELEVLGGMEQDNPDSVGLVGRLRKPMSGLQFAQFINKQLNREPLHIAGSADQINTIAWCTGAAQSYIEQAIEQQVDAYLTGEVSEPTVHVARETGIHFYAAGHHATERYGVKALGEHVAEQFGLEHQFIDIDNPV